LARPALIVTLAALLTAPALAQLGDPTALEPESSSLLWSVPAAVIYELSDLLDRDLMPVTNPRANRGPILRMMDISAGKTTWELPMESDVVSMSSSGDVLIVALHDAIAGVGVTDGAVLWQQPILDRVDTGGDLTPVFRQIRWFGDRWAKSQGIGGAICADGDDAYIKVGQEIYALDVATGDVRWVAPTGFSLATSLVATEDLVLAAIFSDGVSAVERETGRERWFAPITTVSRVYALDGCIYAAGGADFGRLDGETGEVLWSLPVGWSPSQFVYGDGRRIVVRHPTRVYVIDRDEGTLVWESETLPDCSTVVGTDLYIALAEGALQCYSLADATVRWTTAPLGDRPSTVVAAGGAALSVSHGQVMAVNANTGDGVWYWRSAWGFISPDTLAADGDALYLHNSDGRVGRDLRSGDPIVEIPGHYFFTNWMRRKGDFVTLHNGDKLEALRAPSELEDARPGP